MRRTMTASMLNDYLSSAHTTLLLCRAHADHFALTSEEAKDAAYRIHLSIVELEELQADLECRPAASSTNPLAKASEVQDRVAVSGGEREAQDTHPVSELQWPVIKSIKEQIALRGSSPLKSLIGALVRRTHPNMASVG
jgi:hypothetical protein